MDVVKWVKENKAYTAVGLSGLVMPGLGQWVQKRRVWAVFFMSAVLSLILIVFVRSLIDMYRSPIDPSEIGSIFPTTGQVIDQLSAMATSNWHLLLAIAFFWIWSALDAYVAGKRIEKEAGT